MKLTLITLSISVIALYAYVKQSYKYASIQDNVDAPDEIDNVIFAPIDYEETREYKENESWFSGLR